ncbi:SusC/RagA family TonB-linked outer membrane protein [Jejuia spongiicola]|uniref:SusC/RagA family TonB-linked outer membrane protein n=1 Tax=Jejuia spongiicola TaxID=2942207 RepID=A0ABT0QFH6_9FLAO|nr:SusC/RagA family TonB-linked outer membrane protein [Jejuia spongiicola]MCL6295732.1 SusC/RagA family TonB-linked outer membrane protein [Jejuia spongiicola]
MNLKTKLFLIVLLIFNITLFAQNGTLIKGAVVSATDNIPIPGVNVVVLNTSRGTTTDFDGNYQIQVNKGEVLQFSYVGFISQTIIVDTQTAINISLAEDLAKLDEVVVIGYGTQKKSHLTGSISKVVNDDLDQIAVSRVDDALVGQVSGVNIQATDGEAGAAPTITIRGVGSMAGDSTPLIVVDGVIVDSDFLGSLNMNDVKSFEILKDAASSSIYGSKGSNGIIMISMKEGVEGKARINYSTFTGFKEARHSDAYTFSIAETAAAELAANGVISDRTRYKQLIGIDRSWQDVIFDGGTITSHSLSLRGGNDKTKFTTSINYSDDEGVLLTDNFKKYGMRLKVDTKLSDKFKVGASFSPSYTNRRRFDGSTHDILRQTNWLPVYHDANTIQYVNRFKYPDVQIGDYATQRHFDDYDLDAGTSVASGGTDISNTSNTNPAAKVLERERFDKKFKMFGSLYGQYEIIEGLSFRTTLSGSYQDTKRSRWQGVQSNRNGASAAQMSEISQREIYLISDNFFNYNTTIGNHDIGATVGVVFETRDSFFSSISGTGYTSDAVKQITNASLISAADAFEWEKNGISYVSRVNYAYDNKYLVSLSFRRDGSSIFGSDFKYGNFPAASIGWNISNEEFLQDSDVISNLKFRASYGVTGNDRLNTGSVDPDVSSSTSALSTGNILVDYYPSLALLNATTSSIGGSVQPGFSPLNIANPELKWERLVEINPGIDFGLFNNRISGSIDWYQRTSDQLLLNNPVSVTTGFSSALVNLGEVKNEGFEFELRTKNVATENFSWNSTIIATTNKNTLVDFADSNGQIQNVDPKRAAEWINLEGQPISTYYGWVVDRDIPLEYLSNPYHPIGGEAQDVYVKDLNGDGIIDDDDKAALGDPYPELVWSFSNEFKFKNFDFSFMFQGSHGAEIRNMGDQYIFNQFNSSQDFISSTPDQQFIKQKIFTDDIIQDASYIALRNVNIGYNFSKDFLSKYNISGLRIYAAGQNLMYKTADNYTGFNPESIDRQSPTTYGYQRAGSPIFRTISFGLNLDF